MGQPHRCQRVSCVTISSCCLKRGKHRYDFDVERDGGMDWNRYLSARSQPYPYLIYPRLLCAKTQYGKVRSVCQLAGNEDIKLPSALHSRLLTPYAN